MSVLKLIVYRHTSVHTHRKQKARVVQTICLVQSSSTASVCFVVSLKNPHTILSNYSHAFCLHGILLSFCVYNSYNYTTFCIIYNMVNQPTGIFAMQPNRDNAAYQPNCSEMEKYSW